MNKAEFSQWPTSEVAGNMARTGTWRASCSQNQIPGKISLLVRNTLSGRNIRTLRTWQSREAALGESRLGDQLQNVRTLLRSQLMRCPPQTCYAPSSHRTDPRTSRNSAP